MNRLLLCTFKISLLKTIVSKKGSFVDNKIHKNQCSQKGISVFIWLL